MILMLGGLDTFFFFFWVFSFAVKSLAKDKDMLRVMDVMHVSQNSRTANSRVFVFIKKSHNMGRNRVPCSLMSASNIFELFLSV